MAAVGDLRCDLCLSPDLIAIAPGEAGERADLLDVALRRGAPMRAWCWACWPCRPGALNKQARGFGGKAPIAHVSEAAHREAR